MLHATLKAENRAGEQGYDLCYSLSLVAYKCLVIKLSIFSLYIEIQDDNQTLVEPTYVANLSLPPFFPDSKAQIHSME